MTGTERGREKRRADETGGRREGLNSGPLLLRWAGQASGARREHPGWKSGGHTHEEPSGERKQGENESENGEGRGRRLRRKAGRGGGKQHGEVSGTAWSVLSAVGQLSALLSSLGFMSDTIYLAVKPLQPSHSPLSLFLPLTFYN